MLIILSFTYFSLSLLACLLPTISDLSKHKTHKHSFNFELMDVWVEAWQLLPCLDGNKWRNTQKSNDYLSIL
jgi:hypothetical protein